SATRQLAGPGSRGSPHRCKRHHHERGLVGDPRVCIGATWFLTGRPGRTERAAVRYGPRIGGVVRNRLGRRARVLERTGRGPPQLRPALFAVAPPGPSVEGRHDHTTDLGTGQWRALGLEFVGTLRQRDARVVQAVEFSFRRGETHAEARGGSSDLVARHRELGYTCAAEGYEGLGDRSCPNMTSVSQQKKPPC